MGDYATYLERKSDRIGALRAALAQDFAPGEAITLEFGCGHGHWLSAYAEAHPERACLGLDLIFSRIRKANEKKAKRGLSRLHFYRGEANELLEAWPQDRPISEIFMLFPDPWPKARHHKHRMIQSAFLTTIAAKVSTGTRFHFRTDHEDYFAWTREHFIAHPCWEIDEEAPWPWETPTVFQKLMNSWQSLIATRNDAALPHPSKERDLDRKAAENH